MAYKEIYVDELINNISSYIKEGILYTIPHQKLTVGTKVIISFDEYNTSDIYKYKWTLDCRDIEDIFSNISQQIDQPTIEQKIEAINYYIENDAFIDMKNN